MKKFWRCFCLKGQDIKFAQKSKMFNLFGLFCLFSLFSCSDTTEVTLSELESSFSLSVENLSIVKAQFDHDSNILCVDLNENPSEDFFRKMEQKGWIRQKSDIDIVEYTNELRGTRLIFCPEEKLLVIRLLWYGRKR